MNTAESEADPGLMVPLAQGSDAVELSIVMPCLNEEVTLPLCIAKAQRFLRENGIAGEVVIADNGSSDRSKEIALRCGARVVEVSDRGYGSALRGGIAAAKGRYVIMGDADDSYDFSKLEAFVDRLRAGHDLVMGNRFAGGVLAGAMPPLHRYLGNPVLTGIGRLFFRSPVGDFHCGLRGFTKTAYERMKLRTTGMELASEMVVKATLLGMTISEVPTKLHPDGRNRAPHLRSWRDGWRHLRFLLLYSPRWLFLYPGMATMLTGILFGAWLLPRPRTLGPFVLDVHTLLYAAAAVLIGYQAVLFAFFTKAFAIGAGLLPEDKRFSRLGSRVSLEGGLLAGALLTVAGLIMSVFAVATWEAAAFGPLVPSAMLRIIIPAVLAMTLGVETILASFFLSVLALARR